MGELCFVVQARVSSIKSIEFLISEIFGVFFHVAQYIMLIFLNDCIGIQVVLRVLIAFIGR